VTSVRDKGVPASLMTVSNEIGPGGPLLEPYPNWSWYNENDCSGIISVYRVSIKCNHMFVLDCGKIGEEAVCPPKLLVFDLENDMLVKQIIIPPHIANNKN
ncbi:PREDICTED: major royal jelly protein 1-like, partial [Wasmannia auropunctata]|uniref:major royal jelly protein 1-like n=1 Tax=Wasmannia auropunctata TaxID=64793 RepID=UPI0005F063E2